MERMLTSRQGKAIRRSAIGSAVLGILLVSCSSGRKTASSQQGADAALPSPDGIADTGGTSGAGSMGVLGGSIGGTGGSVQTGGITSITSGGTSSLDTNGSSAGAHTGGANSTDSGGSPLLGGSKSTATGGVTVVNTSGSSTAPNTGTQSDAGAMDDLDAEEEAVYAVLLANTTGKSRLLRARTAIDGPGSTNPSQAAKTAMGRLNGVAQATSDSFFLRNATATLLRADMTLGTPYILLSETDPIWQDPKFWPTLRARYPDAQGIPQGVGHETLSKVGFNASRDQALVYMGSETEWLIETPDHYAGYGAGYYYRMKKVNGLWIVDQKAAVWTT